MESTEMEFWDSRYRAAKTPWDFGSVPMALTAYLGTASPGCVLIPGCGSGYEIRAFEKHEWEVVALDYSPAAVDRAQRASGSPVTRIILADFFGHDFKREKFDVIYERTFLCSQPPKVWAQYARRMSELLVDSGKLIGFFLYGDETEPPPYPLTEQQAQELFGEYFVRTGDAPVTDSMPVFAGRERWQVWKNIHGDTVSGYRADDARKACLKG